MMRISAATDNVRIDPDVLGSWLGRKTMPDAFEIDVSSVLNAGDIVALTIGIGAKRVVHIIRYVPVTGRDRRVILGRVARISWNV